MPTKKELGKSLRQVREKYGQRNRTYFAAQLGLNDSLIYDRETGRTAIGITDLIDYAKVLGVSPVVLLAELLSNCDRDYWQDIAEQLDCTVPMAKQRLATAQKAHGLNHGQVWHMYLQEQIKL